jgi:hypothetical protein
MRLKVMMEQLLVKLLMLSTGALLPRARGRSR